MHHGSIPQLSGVSSPLQRLSLQWSTRGRSAFLLSMELENTRPCRHPSRCTRHSRKNPGSRPIRGVKRGGEGRGAKAQFRPGFSAGPRRERRAEAKGAGGGTRVLTAQGSRAVRVGTALPLGHMLCGDNLIWGVRCCPTDYSQAGAGGLGSTPAPATLVPVSPLVACALERAI